MDEIGQRDYRIKKAEVVFYPDTRVQHDTGQGGKGRERRDGHGRDACNEVKDCLHDIAAMVEAANGQLEVQDSPYRFSLRREGPDIFIDIIITDRRGKILAVREKNITHEKFMEAVEHIHAREGLFFDQVG